MMSFILHNFIREKGLMTMKAPFRIKITEIYDTTLIFRIKITEIYDTTLIIRIKITETYNTTLI